MFLIRKCLFVRHDSFHVVCVGVYPFQQDRHSRKCFLGISMEFLAKMALHCGMVIPGVAGRLQVRSWSWGWQDGELKQEERCPDPQSVLALWFVFHFMLFVLYYKGEKSSKNVEKSCFCHSRNGKASRLSKILANGRSCFQLNSICSFPKVPHLLCCRAGDLTPVSYKENYATQTA